MCGSARVAWCVLLLAGLSANAQAQLDLGTAGKPLPAVVVDLVASVNGEVEACPKWLLDDLKSRDKTVCSRFSPRPGHRQSLDQVLELRNPIEAIGWEVYQGYGASKIFAWSAAPTHVFVVVIFIYDDLLSSSRLNISWGWVEFVW